MQPPFIDLLALPCAGASASMYMRWRRLLPEWVRVIPVELPGRGARLGEPCGEDFAELVARLCEERSAQMQGRFALFGHSMGALLAHGMAQRQRALLRPLPITLFASGSPAPSRRDPQRFAGKDSDASLIADLHKQGGTPAEVFDSAELLRLTLDTLRADYRVCASHRHVASDPLPVALHAFAGRDDDIGADRVEAWQRETSQDFTIDWFHGGHFFIRQHEQQVLAAIGGVLTRQLFGAGRAWVRSGEACA